MGSALPILDQVSIYLKGPGGGDWGSSERLWLWLLALVGVRGLR